MMTPRSTAAAAAVLLLALAVAGCAKSTDTTADASASPAAETSAAVEPVASPLVSASPTATVAASSAAPAVALTDIAGVNGEKDIAELAALGVVDPVSGAFRPGAPIARRDFIRWLVKANNVLWNDTPAKRIVLADTTEAAFFPDVPTSDPDFPYVQGMQDAGYSVGFPDKTFRPNAPLTREQMFAIKNVFDRGTVDAGLVKSIDFARNTAMAPWKDRAAISKTYVPAIATGAGGGAENFALVYGTSSLFRPQAPVTREQAAMLVTAIGDHTFYGSATRTLARALASPAP